MDLRRLVLYYLVMTLFLLALAAGAYTGLSEVSDEARDIRRRLDWVTRIDPVHADLSLLRELPAEERAVGGARPVERLREAALRLRAVPPEFPHAVASGRLADTLDRTLADPGDDALAEAIAAARILRDAAFAESIEALREQTDRPASRRARDILYGSLVMTLLGSGIFTVLYLRALRERRTAADRVRRAEALAALGTLAAGVAHEVNNPLGTISACAESARGRFEEDPDRARELLATVIEEAHRCSAIVRGLMDLARDGLPAAGPVDVAALVSETVALASLNPRLQRVPIDTDLEGEAPVVVADAGRLKQAVLNLLANAVEVSPEGTRVRVTVRSHGGGAEVCVRDHGPGVPPRDRRRIFEPFRTGRSDGTGLGLTIVDRVASVHGGTVDVEDAPGGGAVFRLRLPARPPGSA